jgi:hypothetical protein
MCSIYDNAFDTLYTGRGGGSPAPVDPGIRLRAHAGKNRRQMIFSPDQKEVFLKIYIIL